jgi:GTPase SAR1 family protein
MNQLLEERVPVVILGNKIDLVSNIGEVIDRDELKDYADKIGSKYIETSAKSGDNVQKAFVELTKMIVENSFKV